MDSYARLSVSIPPSPYRINYSNETAVDLCYPYNGAVHATSDPLVQ